VRSDFSAAVYLVAVVVLVLVKAVLVSDLSVEIIYAPHDDSLYVERALHFLNGNAFGPYDARTLAKLPGISLWLAATTIVGLPHLLAVNVLYLAAGLYVVAGLGRAGITRSVRLLAFALYLFNPVTVGAEWLRVLREPLGTGLFVLLLGAMLHLLLAVKQRTRMWPHATLLAIVLSFALLVREDDKLLWALLPTLAFAMWRVDRHAFQSVQIGPWRILVTAAAIPAACAIVADSTTRAFIESHYGRPILHDISEGEFPRLLAAIRSVKSQTDNRLVMAPRETLERLRKVAPEFVPVIDRIPPVGPHTPSCRLQGVCSEWSNGWMPFWIKDGAAKAGFLPDLPSGQAYFRKVRTRIESACQRGELKCEPHGKGFIPPFELRWTRAYMRALGLMFSMALSPEPFTVTNAPVLYNVPRRLAKKFQSVTMTDHADTLEGVDLLRLPEARLYVSPFAGWRAPIAQFYQPVAWLLIVVAALALVWRWTWFPDAVESPVFWIGAVFFGFALLRLAALAYVAVFLGPFDSRIFFATYSAALILAPAVIADAYAEWRSVKSFRSA